MVSRSTASDFPFVAVDRHDFCSNHQSLWKSQKKRNIFMHDSYAPVPEIIKGYT